MPTATKSRRRSRQREETEPQGARPLEARSSELEADPDHNSPTASTAFVTAAFDPFRAERDGGLPFMDAIAQISEAEWEQMWLYCYRLDPAIRNPEDENKYIGRYQCAMNEDEIRAQHGGGKYLFILKEITERGVTPRSRKCKFRIDGQPILRAGQSMPAGSEPAPAPPPAPSNGRDDSGAAALVRALPELMKSAGARQNSEAGMDQVVEMIGKAAQGAITIVTESVKQSQTTVTGSLSGDKLLDILMTQLKADRGGPPQRSAVEEAVLKIGLARLETPASSAGDGGLGQLSAVKDLLGVDNILDLIKPNAAGDTWKAKLVEMGAALVTNIPMILNGVAAMQESRFRQSLQLEAFRRQQQPPIPGQAGAVASIPPTPNPSAPPPQPGAAAPPPPPPAPVFATAPQPGADRRVLALEDIVFCYQSGFPGNATAGFVRSKYPEVLQMLSPLLANRDQTMMFTRQTAPLNLIAGDEEFPEFLDAFVQEALHPDDAAEPEATGGPAT